MKNLKPFNLEKALAGEPVMTLGGREVIEIHCLKSDVICKLIVVLKGINVDSDEPRSYTVCGKTFTTHESLDDLVMAPKKRTIWINLYQLNSVYQSGSFTYTDEQTAVMERNLGLGTYYGAYPLEIEE